MGEVLWALVWLLALLAVNAFFVAAEFAIIATRRSQIEPLAQAGDARARTVLHALENLSPLLACAQLGVTVSSLLILNVTEPPLKKFALAPLLNAGVPSEVAVPLVFVGVVGIVTFLHVTFAEMVPKNLSVSLAERAALNLAPLLVVIYRVLHPVISALNWCANTFVRALGVEPRQEVNSSFTLEEVRSIVAESTRHGVLNDEAGLLAGALEFSARTAQMVMVPRDQLYVLPRGASAAQVEAAVRQSGFSRYVVASLEGHLLGYIHVKDVLDVSQERKDVPVVSSVIRELVDVDAGEEIEEALRVMQRSGSHMAQVVGEAGRVLGVLFFEDVIEELVGEIRERQRH